MHVQGIPLLIEWDKFVPGASFFVPCLDYRPTARMIAAEARRLRFNIIMKRVVERKMYGLRVWRIDDTIAPHSS